MYINIPLIIEKGFNPYQILLLQCIKQNSTEDLSEFLPMIIQSDQDLEILQEKELIKFIKGKKGQSDFERIRVSDKGKKLLEDIETIQVEEVDIQMFEYLCEMYLKHEDEERHIGNKKKVKIYCAIFRKHLDLSPHQAYWVYWLFLQDYVWTKKLENIFFDSNKNRYGNFKKNIEDSPVYQYYDQNKENIINFWKKKGCYESKI